jgi:glycosyl transferase family 1
VTDLLVVSLGTTLGWRVADRLFCEQAEQAGASTTAVAVGQGAAGRLRRGYPLNDFVEAAAARRTLQQALRRERPRGVVFSSSTTAMLAPSLDLPYAVRLDGPAALNRTGPLNAPVRALERRALSRARRVLPWSEPARDGLPAGSAPAVVLPPPVVSSGAHEGDEPLAVAYVPDPKAKGLDVVAEAWARAAVPGARLEVFAVEPDRAARHLRRHGLELPASATVRGVVAPEEFRATLRRARVLVAGARWEDFGQAPLEALADGALLATVPTAGPFAALPLARRLDPRLVSDDLASAVTAAFARGDLDSYRTRAAELLRPFGPEALVSRIRDEVLPPLLG